MNDRETIDIDAQRMLEAYRVGTSPSATETTKLWARLGVPVALPVAATPAVLKIVVGVALVVGGGAAVIRPRAPEPVRAEVVARSVAPTTPRETEPAIEPAVLPEAVAVAAVTAPMPVVAHARPSTPPRVQAIEAEAPALGLADEIAVLEQARVAVGRGDTTRALALLEEHARDFPSGALVEERRAMRIIALCGLDDSSKGRAEARVFLAGHRASALASRIRDACAMTESESSALPRGEP